ncbi:hypothetical protein DFH08DRAFT_840207 [Mycena albidolilacea]|uniref:SET domain-containing protein n=1 Tax=Mycena albidolilacea TaxID=1033008 RepID=A0AAD7AQ88_9AGAR|nr:hypothetical protein DFH08DRAFT_840207 [Mycena albidolilacea]
MTESTAVENLLFWCSKRGFWIDPRIQVIAGPCGVAVISRDISIPADSTLVRIPRESVLSVKSSSITDLIPPHSYGRGAQLSLALALSVELVIGATSPFFLYLQSLPRDLPSIPLFWACGANQPSLSEYGPPTEWLNGTEASKMLFDPGDNDTSLVDEIGQYFHQVARSVYAKVFESSPEMIPTLRGFYHAYALVSSRSFLVDSYHGLAMVPIADAFNHAQENHVHLESDFDVCPECGSLQRCVHDDTGDHIPRSTTISDEADDFYDMVSNLAIPPNSEVFNTYGETLSNTELLVQYGFILDGNDNDHLTWTFDELAQFSENHFSASSASWTWNSIGGLAYFKDLLRSINSLPWDHISESELVHLDRSHGFSLNGDAVISHSLWLYFALLVCLRNGSSIRPSDQSRDNSVILLEETLQFQLTLEQEEDLVPPPLPDDDRRRASPYSSVILELARLLVSLCRTRSARTGRAGVEMAELGDVLDRLPNDMTPTKMAISLALTERSLLDSCMSAWESIADCLGQA